MSDKDNGDKTLLLSGISKANHKQTLDMNMLSKQNAKGSESLVSSAPSVKSGPVFGGGGSPGSIHTGAQITIHSRLAHSFFFGREAEVEWVGENKRNQKRIVKKEGIVGLIKFGHNMKYIWDLSAKDDPYADARLLDVEAALSKAGDAVKAGLSQVDDLIGDLGNISIGDTKSNKPVSLPLSFRTPYGFLAARLLSDFDDLVLKALAGLHMGFIMHEDMGQVQQRIGKKIRHAFHLSGNFRGSGCSRDDFAANNAKAQSAVSRYGKLDGDILSGVRRAKISPRIDREDLRS